MKNKGENHPFTFYAQMLQMKGDQHTNLATDYTRTTSRPQTIKSAAVICTFSDGYTEKFQLKNFGVNTIKKHAQLGIKEFAFRRAEKKWAFAYWAAIGLCSICAIRV